MKIENQHNLPNNFELSNHLQINFLVAVGASLFLADNAPAADAELVKLMSAGQLEGILDDSLLPSLD